MILGYCISILTYFEDTLVDTNSGLIKITKGNFPFKKTNILSNRTFNFLYPATGHNSPNWILVQRDNIVLSLVQDSYYQGQFVINGQRDLINAYQIKKFSDSERNKIAREYFSYMRSKKYSEANEFAFSIWENAAQDK